jgi:hypothetical protein
MRAAKVMTSRPSIRELGVFNMLVRQLTSWRRGRELARTLIQLEALRQCALSAPDAISRDFLIVSANVLLGDLQARGIITLAERREFALEWIRDYVRGCLPALYRCKKADAVDRLGSFLRANAGRS